MIGLLLQCKHHTVANVSPINWKKLKACQHVPNSCKLKGVLLKVPLKVVPNVSSVLTIVFMSGHYKITIADLKL